MAIFPLLGAAGPVGSLHLAEFGREKFAWHAELLETACRTCGPLLVRHHDREFEEATVAAVESALMPRSVPQVEGLDLEVAFTSATEGARVGGDFYDVIELDSGDALVFVGDYTGNGIEVAGTAARVREAVASLGREDVEPGELLRRVNRVLRDILPAGRLVTLAVCRFSRKGDVTVAVAGHPWPLRLDPEGDADEITLPPNVPAWDDGGRDVCGPHSPPRSGPDPPAVLRRDQRFAARRGILWGGRDSERVERSEDSFTGGIPRRPLSRERALPSEWAFPRRPVGAGRSSGGVARAGYRFPPTLRHCYLTVTHT